MDISRNGAPSDIYNHSEGEENSRVLPKIIFHPLHDGCRGTLVLGGHVLRALALMELGLQQNSYGGGLPMNTDGRVLDSTSNIYACTYIYMHIYLLTYMYVYMYIYIHIHMLIDVQLILGLCNTSLSSAQKTGFRVCLVVPG